MTAAEIMDRYDELHLTVVLRSQLCWKTWEEKDLPELRAQIVSMIHSWILANNTLNPVGPAVTYPVNWRRDGIGVISGD